MTQQDETSRTLMFAGKKLAQIAASHSALTVPGYDRDSIRLGIMHFGVGGFHRAYQAVVVDDLLQKGAGRE
ncbi:hypothetical protein ABZ260_17450 [Streptosporangium sp. NPDC006013]|uniref:hypothetical protein n=1 Tax=Streptosporangium sp. NPDC006013 TaxID=3155596 RepID=UPI0033AF7BC1